MIMLVIGAVLAALCAAVLIREHIHDRKLRRRANIRRIIRASTTSR